MSDELLRFSITSEPEPTEKDAVRAVATLLRFVGEDPSRAGLLGTPIGVMSSLLEMTSGYDDDPEEILSTTEVDAGGELVILRNVHFDSLCEDHLLAFSGEVTIGYVPGKVVGLSKLARVVQCFSRRLQLQERLTEQIADAIEMHLNARGVGVIVTGRHLCIACRGVQFAGTQVVTSAMRGRLHESGSARLAFLQMCTGSDLIERAATEK